jgi:hypothetical protein
MMAHQGTRPEVAFPPDRTRVDQLWEKDEERMLTRALFLSVASTEKRAFAYGRNVTVARTHIDKILIEAMRRRCFRGMFEYRPNRKLRSNKSEANPAAGLPSTGAPPS